MAALLIEQLGDRPIIEWATLARSGGLPHDESVRLLEIADEIDRRQGFGWFGDEQPEAKASPS